MKKKLNMNELADICTYDEGYTKDDALNIGWCGKCECDPDCICVKIRNGEIKYDK